VTGAIKVSVRNLREGLGLLLDEIERRHGSFVDLGTDFYWVIDREASYGLDLPQPADVTVGQLSDDVASLHIATSVTTSGSSAATGCSHTVS
jgi:hypothetical protein